MRRQGRELGDCLRTALIFRVSQHSCVKNRCSICVHVFLFCFGLMSMGVCCTYVCVSCVCSALRGQTRTSGPLELELQCCELPHGCWELSLDPLEAASALATEPSLPPPLHTCFCNHKQLYDEKCFAQISNHDVRQICKACSPWLRKQSAWLAVWTDDQLSSAALLGWHWLSA